MSPDDTAIVEAIDRVLDLLGRCSHRELCTCANPAEIRCQAADGHHGQHVSRSRCRPSWWSEFEAL